MKKQQGIEPRINASCSTPLLKGGCLDEQAEPPQPSGVRSVKPITTDQTVHRRYFAHLQRGVPESRHYNFRQ